MDGKANILSGDLSNLEQTKDTLRNQSNLVSLAETQRMQSKKAKEAAEYRARILKQQEGSKQDTAQLSPAFNKEKVSLVRSKKHKADTEKVRKDLDGKATTAQCVFNLSNILMGVGLLTLPYTCKVAGTIGGVIAIVSLGFISWRTSIMIGRSLNGDCRPLSCFDDPPWKTPLQPGSTPEARMRKPISGFPEIAREAFGNFGSFMLACVLYFELFSCIGIFLVSIGDHIHTLFPGHPTSVYMIGTALFSGIPVILLRTARLLSYLSMVGTVATICVVCAVVLSYLFEGDITERIANSIPESEPPYHEAFRLSGMPLSLGLVAYCFSGHAIVPCVQNCC